MTYEYWLLVKADCGVIMLNKRISKLGREGWELVAVDDKYCYFKRGKS